MMGSPAGLFHTVLLTNDGQMLVPLACTAHPVNVVSKPVAVNCRLLRRADNEVHELTIPDLHDNQRPFIAF